MKTNSIHSDRNSNISKFSPAPGHGLLKCKMLLCLALPLTLAVGYASDLYQPAVADNFTPVAVVAPVSARVAANKIVGHEIFEMFMADKSLNYLSASVNNGVVTLRGTVPNEAERQKIDDQMRELAGVNQVKDELADLSSPLPAVAVGN